MSTTPPVSTLDRPATLVEALVADDPDVAFAAYARLRGRVRQLARRRAHPSLQDTDDSVDDATQLFCEQYVLGSQERAALSTLVTWKGLDTAILRCLSRCRGVGVEDHPDPYFDHLWNKLSQILREDDTFEQLPAQGVKRWRLRRAPLRPRRCTFEDACRQLPAIPSQFLQVRDDQLPPVVSADEARRQLVRLFEWTDNRPLSVSDLALAVYESLSPPPPRRLLVDPGDSGGPLDASATGAGPERAMADAQAARLAVEFLRSLPSRTLAAAWWRYGPAAATLEEVAVALGCSRGTADNLIGDKRGSFQRDFRRFASDIDDGLLPVGAQEDVVRAVALRLEAPSLPVLLEELAAARFSAERVETL